MENKVKNKHWYVYKKKLFSNPDKYELFVEDIIGKSVEISIFLDRQLLNRFIEPVDNFFNEVELHPYKNSPLYKAMYEKI